MRLFKLIKEHPGEALFLLFVIPACLLLAAMSVKLMCEVLYA